MRPEDGEQVGPRLGRIVQLDAGDGQEEREIGLARGEGAVTQPHRLGAQRLRLRGGGRVVGAVGLAYGQRAGDERHDEQYGHPGEEAAEASVDRAWWRARSSAARSAALVPVTTNSSTSPATSRRPRSSSAAARRTPR